MTLPRLTLVVGLLISPLLLIGGVSESSPRSIAAAWDAGHAVLFALLTVGVLASIAPSPRTRARILIVTLAISAALALAIEWVQGFVGRQQSWNDVILSLAGVLIALPFTEHWRALFPGLPVALSRLVVVVGITTPIAVPILRFVADEHAMAREFPVLSDLSSRTQATRWEVTAGGTWEAPEPGQHSGALAVNGQAGRTTSWQLVHFKRDWRNFSTVEMRFHFTGTSDTLTCILNDLLHDRTVPHEDSDHYEARLPIMPGWQVIRLELEAAASSLRTRRMNLAEINSLRCFVRDSASDVRVLVDEVRLLR